MQCARHGFYRAKGTADLAKGEAYVLFFTSRLHSLKSFLSYARTDYALAQALLEEGDQRWIMVTYDIWCQFSVKLKERFAKSFPHLMPLIDCLRGAIPKMHIHNHIAACQLIWALNFIKYSAETYGEAIESGWAEQNESSGSTKEMNAGHRHDSLDDIFGFWNWLKLTSLGMG